MRAPRLATPPCKQQQRYAAPSTPPRNSKTPQHFSAACAAVHPRLAHHPSTHAFRAAHRPQLAHNFKGCQGKGRAARLCTCFAWKLTPPAHAAHAPKRARPPCSSLFLLRSTGNGGKREDFTWSKPTMLRVLHPHARKRTRRRGLHSTAQRVHGSHALPRRHAAPLVQNSKPRTRPRTPRLLLCSQMARLRRSDTGSPAPAGAKPAPNTARLLTSSRAGQRRPSPCTASTAAPPGPTSCRAACRAAAATQTLA